MSEKVMQYVGARYVPKFADPIEWQENTSYEALTVVMYNNSSYTSKIPVPANVGIPATNDKYWALTGNYNGQIEEYRQDTEKVKNKQSTLETKIDQEISDRSALIFNNNGKADVPVGLSVEGKLSANDGAEISGMLKYGEAQNKDNVESVPFTSTSGNEYDLMTSKNAKAHHLIFGDSWVALDEVSTHPDRTNWYRSLTQFFPNIHDFAVSGSLFSSLPSQVERAINDQSFTNSSVKTIIIVCGVNDYRTGVGANEAVNNLNNVLKTIYASFSNANVTCFIDTFAPFTMYLDYEYNFKKNWLYGRNISDQAKCSTYPLSPYLCLQRFFEASGVSSFHLNALGSSVLEKVFTDVICGMTPSYHLQIYGEENYQTVVTQTISGEEKEVTSDVTGEIAFDLTCNGNHSNLGFYYFNELESSNNYAKLKFVINDSTDYNLLVPLPGELWDTHIAGSNGGFLYFSMYGTTLDMYSSNKKFTMLLYTDIHAA